MQISTEANRSDIKKTRFVLTMTFTGNVNEQMTQWSFKSPRKWRLTRLSVCRFCAGVTRDACDWRQIGSALSLARSLARSLVVFLFAFPVLNQMRRLMWRQMDRKKNKYIYLSYITIYIIHEYIHTLHCIVVYYITLHTLRTYLPTYIHTCTYACKPTSVCVIERYILFTNGSFPSGCITNAAALNYMEADPPCNLLSIEVAWEYSVYLDFNWTLIHAWHSLISSKALILSYYWDSCVCKSWYHHSGSSLMISCELRDRGSIDSDMNSVYY